MLYLNTGTNYGKEGYMFMRMNVGSPYKTVEKALIRLANAVGKMR